MEVWQNDCRRPRAARTRPPARLGLARSPRAPRTHTAKATVQVFPRREGLRPSAVPFHPDAGNSTLGDNHLLRLRCALQRAWSVGGNRSQAKTEASTSYTGYVAPLNVPEIRRETIPSIAFRPLLACLDTDNRQTHRECATLMDPRGPDVLPSHIDDDSDTCLPDIFL